jgi:hypothetical protein
MFSKWHSFCIEQIRVDGVYSGKFDMNKAIIAAALFAGTLAQPALAAGYVNVWTTTFESGFFESIGPFPSTSLSITFGGSNIESSGTTPGTGSKYLRNATAGTTTFGVSGLGSHNSLKLSFDIEFLDSWDGFDGACCAPDWLFANVDGTSYQWTSNTVGGTSPVFAPGVFSVPAGFYAANPSWPDVIVHYDFLIPHTASNFTLAFNAGGAGFQFGDDESWAIDNFSLSAAAVPEPASWAMLIAGFGLVGAVARRRRTAIAEGPREGTGKAHADIRRDRRADARAAAL